ncbi:MAG: dihydroneopterin aldolase [Desulfobacteraceae bacterium]|nr:dihydroneopterin aldolase [Desulfobacteraceae bacterium]
MPFDPENCDVIYIRDILVRGILGVRSYERVKKQDIVIHLTLWADIRKAGETDNLDDSFDYSELKNRIVELAESSCFFLIEKLADAIAQVCLEEQKIHQVKIAVEKPGALRFAKTVGIEIIRRKPTESTHNEHS